MLGVPCLGPETMGEPAPEEESKEEIKEERQRKARIKRR